MSILMPALFWAATPAAAPIETPVTPTFVEDSVKEDRATMGGADCKPYPQFQFDAKMQQSSWFSDFHKADGFRKVVATFKRGYDHACASGHFASGTDLADGPSIILRNASDSNTLILYPAEFDDAPPQPLIFLEYHYHRDGKFYTPSDAEMEEAIFCYAVNATDDQRANEGRCMPD